MTDLCWLIAFLSIVSALPVAFILGVIHAILKANRDDDSRMSMFHRIIAGEIDLSHESNQSHQTTEVKP